jgi:hypothetical protein
MPRCGAERDDSLNAWSSRCRRRYDVTCDRADHDGMLRDISRVAARWPVHSVELSTDRNREGGL